MNNDKKNDAKEEEHEEFTGSPEQQFPDFEAEGQRDQQKEQNEKEKLIEKQKPSDV
ncbi:hypothetical protein QOZ98_000153 [Planomicrobium stackebrandtii]|uniref:3-methyladenine DNA glycosylase n=1 Tax=Planomicrobium stackebrandtii TaxID=253160 RepID=A0ABU0GQI6_9BACL|nr:hypothetical protein [Planomicrobium stackebrandtii]MDQ0427328.1 hypothetical protein [Planomicrobium stackebrandtii]